MIAAELAASLASDLSCKITPLNRIAHEPDAAASSGPRARRSAPAGSARLHYLGANARLNEKNRWFLFRKVLRLDAAPTEAPLSITVDGRYILYVNGRKLGRGPVRCSPLFQRYDDYDIAAVPAAQAPM